ncbi:MAG: hypothetical protein ACI4AK_07610 [Lepagella sp.]
MRKSFIITILLVGSQLLAFSCSGATKGNIIVDSSRVDDSDSVSLDSNIKFYVKVLEDFACLMSGGYDDVPDDYYGIFSYRNYGGEEGEALEWQDVRNNIGYCFKDFDGDSKDELVIGMNLCSPNVKKGLYTMLCAVYKDVKGQPTLILSSGGRDAWYFMDDHSFFYTGAESAACSVCGSYIFSHGELTCDHYWFSSLNESGDLDYYQSYYDSVDTSKARRLDFTIKDFDNLQQEFLEQAVELPLTFFNTLRPHAFITSNGKFCFACSEKLCDFKLLALTDMTITDEGKLSYKETVKQTFGVLKTQKPIEVKLDIMGDLPEYAISFIDPLGYPVKMLLTISGKDGSPLLTQE